MNRGTLRRRVVRTLLAAALLAPAGGCTAIDDYVDGTPFTPDQPVALVELQGPVNRDLVGPGSATCAAGTTVLWGWVKNTGDLDVDDVTAVIDAFGPTGGFLGSFRDKVYNGEVTAGEDSGSLDTASTSLTVEQSGSFTVCTSLPFGTVARVEFRTEFIVIDTSEIQ
jgi:hypothetical protein